ncbi:MAG: hypothetical protein LBS64_04155 [Spirochaetaceae bacterium]|jgi:hypothetical protein|nr:hypothetical protein [Spirochaetaceae bacterium]
MQNETKAFFRQQLKEQAKTWTDLARRTGYILLSAEKHIDGDAVAAYNALEEKKQDAVKSISTIQGLTLTQKDGEQQLTQLAKTRKKYAADQEAAYARLGAALFGDPDGAAAGEFPQEYAGIAVLREKLSAGQRTLRDAAEKAGGKNVFTKVVSSVRSSAASAGISTLNRQIGRACANAAQELFVGDKLAVSQAASTGAVMESAGECRTIAAVLEELDIREGSVQDNIRDSREALAREGVRAGTLIRITELRKVIAQTGTEEDELALKTGITFLNAQLTSEGTPQKGVQKPDPSVTVIITDAAALRRSMTATEMNIRLWEMDEQVAALSERMRKGHERIRGNNAAVRKLTDDSAETERMIQETNGVCEKLKADREALAEQRNALS